MARHSPLKRSGPRKKNHRRLEFEGFGGILRPRALRIEPLEARMLLSVVTWSGGTSGTGTNFETATNWVGGVLPGPNDEAYIPSAFASETITSATSISIGSLVSEAQFQISAGTFTVGTTAEVDNTLTLSGGSLSIGANSTIAGNVNLSGGTLGGAGNVTFGGTVNWTGGTMAGTGLTDVASTGTLNLSGNNGVQLYGVLETDGATNWSGGISIQMFNGTINNYGTWTVNSSSTVYVWSNTGGTTNSFNNGSSATFIQEGTGTTSFSNSPGVAFNNAGTVNVNNGTLQFFSGGSQSGPFSGNTGASLELGGNHSFTSAATISGSLNVLVVGGTSSDPATISTTGTLTFEGGTFTANAAVSAASINVTGGTANFNAGATATNGTISSGTLAGSGNVTFGGTVAWTGGTIAGTGLTDVASTGTLNLSGNNGVQLYGVLETDGATNWSGGISIEMFNGTINNYGTWTVNSSSTVYVWSNTGGTTNSFNNGSSATFIQEGTGTTSFSNSPGVAFNNAGTVNVNNGTLQFFSGGSQSGPFSGNTGASLELGGNHSFTSAATISGSLNVLVVGGTSSDPATISTTGTLTFEGGTFTANAAVSAASINVTGGTANFNAGATATNGTISSGTLAGSGNVTFGGTVAWTGGTIAGTGLTDVASTGTLNLSGNNGVQLYGVLETDGATNWSGGISIQMFNGTINNYGTWTVNSSSTVYVWSNTGGTTNSFNNESSGTFIQQGTGKTVFSNNPGVAFNNAGMVNVNSGTLELDSGVTQVSGTTLTGGTWNVLAGSTLSISGAAINTNDGNVTLSGAVSFAAINGLAVNNGGFTLPAGETFTTTGNFTNNGSLSVGGTLNVAGTYSQPASGTLVEQIGGTAAGQFGSIAVTGAAALAGTLGVDLTGGFQPTLNSTTAFLTAPSITGQFGSVVNTVPGNAYAFSATYTPTAAPTVVSVLAAANGAPVVTTEPVSTAVSPGQTATFTALASGNPTVQWQVSSNGGGTFTPIPGATSTTLSFTATLAESGNVYEAVFTNTAGTATTFPATLTVANSLVTWVGGAAAGPYWDVAANWSTDAVPTAANNVVIESGAATTITIRSADTESINSLTTAAGYNLAMSGGSLAIGSPSTTSVLGGNVNLSGGTLTVSGDIQFNNTFTLAGGTLVGATVLPGTGGQGITCTSSGGTLDGVTVNASLDLTASSAFADLTNGLTLDGTATLGSNAAMYFSGTQTFSGSGEVVFAGSANATSYLYAMGNNSVAGAATLTIGANITIEGSQNGQVLGYYSPDKLINQGTILSETAARTITVNATSGVTNQGTIQAISGGSLTIANMVNAASVSISGGGTLSLEVMYANTGVVSAVNSTLTLNYSWNNATGTITASNSTVNLGGNFTTAGLGTFNRTGGTVNLSGTLTNTGTTLNLDATTGSLNLSGGTISGGTITANTAQLTVSSGTLNGVTLGTNVAVGNGVSLSVTNGLTLNNANVTLESTNSNTSVNFQGTQTLAGTGQIVFGGSSSANRVYAQGGGSMATAATLTIAPNVSVQGPEGGTVSGYYSQDGIVNQGTIDAGASGQTITVASAGSFTNRGTLEATGASTLTLSGTWTNASTITATSATLNLGSSSNAWSNAGTITATNSTVNLGGNFTTAGLGTFNRTGGTVNLSGTLTNTGTTLNLDATTGSLNLSGGTISGGTITANTAQLTVGSGTLNGVTLGTNVAVGNGVSLSVTNGLTLNNANVTLESTNSNTSVNFQGTQTLAGTGQIVFGGSAPYNRVYAQGGGSMATAATLTIAPNVSVQGPEGGTVSGYYSQDGIVNQGTIDAGASGQTITVGSAGSFTNRGTLEATGASTLTLSGTWTNSGTIQTQSGGTVSAATAPTNYATGTLTGGTWNVLAGSTLSISGAAITTNDANITLSGANSTFAAINGLAVNNSSFSVLAGRTFTTSGNLTNNGSLTIGGALNVTGNFTQSAAGTLIEQVGGTAAGQFGSLAATGTAALAGTLGVDLTGGFQPGQGTGTLFLSAQSVSGQFTSVINSTPGSVYSFSAITRPPPPV